MKEKIQKFREYLDYIEEHYDNVQKAWRLLNDKMNEKHRGSGVFTFMSDDFKWHSIDMNIKMHDVSKLSAEEFTQYRQSFYPCVGEEYNESAMLDAWIHHKQVNQHHWENWVDGCANSEIALIENICDWMAMGFKLGDTARDYYNNNKADIEIPKWAEEYMYEIFDCVYGSED